MRPVGLILLAAGASTRLGQPKQLARYKGQTLLRRAAATAISSRCRPVVVVLGAQAERMQPELDGLAVSVIVNPEWQSGMASSLQTGLQALEEGASGVAVILCDQPLLTVETLDALVDAWEAADAPLAACEYAGALGVPAVFGRQLFPELAALSGAEGAKKVIVRHAALAARVAFPGGAWDIDRPQDLKRLSSR